jgi:endoglycosylceramidase
MRGWAILVRSKQRRRRSFGAWLGIAAALVAGETLATPPGVSNPEWRGRRLSDPIPPLRHEGRWFVDAAGRVVLLHGVNFVEKNPPFYPAAVGFGSDDAAFLAKRALNVFRLGVVFEAIMPEPGRIDFVYIEHLAKTVHDLAAQQIFVLLDFHQDGYGPAVHGNGMPGWSTFTDGLPNPPVPFPIYYVSNRALQRAFDNFWANRIASDGVGLQEHYVAAARALAERLRREPYVLGFEAMNEPWPGTVWFPCLTGCPDLETQLLVPFYQRFADAVHAADPDALVFVEPFSLFNFGFSDSSLPAIGAPGNAFSFHAYALSSPDNLAVIDHGVAAAERTGDALLATEWGAITDPAAIELTSAQFDDRLVPWIFWAYTAEVVLDPSLPPTGDNVRESVVQALTRTYPLATNGTPIALAFDPATKTLMYEYSTQQPSGRRRRCLATGIEVPPAVYPNGYRVAVQGAVVISRPGAARLELLNLPKATTVSVEVTPFAVIAPSADLTPALEQSQMAGNDEGAGPVQDTENRREGEGAAADDRCVHGESEAELQH